MIVVILTYWPLLVLPTIVLFSICERTPQRGTRPAARSREILHQPATVVPVRYEESHRVTSLKSRIIDLDEEIERLSLKTDLFDDDDDDDDEWEREMVRDEYDEAVELREELGDELDDIGFGEDPY